MSFRVLWNEHAVVSLAPNTGLEKFPSQYLKTNSSGSCCNTGIRSRRSLHLVIVDWTTFVNTSPIVEWLRWAKNLPQEKVKPMRQMIIVSNNWSSIDNFRLFVEDFLFRFSSLTRVLREAPRSSRICVNNHSKSSGWIPRVCQLVSSSFEKISISSLQIVSICDRNLESMSSLSSTDSTLHSMRTEF